MFLVYKHVEIMQENSLKLYVYHIHFNHDKLQLLVFQHYNQRNHCNYNILTFQSIQYNILLYMIKLHLIFILRHNKVS